MRLDVQTKGESMKRSKSMPRIVSVNGACEDEYSDKFYVSF